MYINLSEGLFVGLMGDRDYHGFSYKGLEVIYQMIEEFEDFMGEPTKFDRAAIKMAYSEYDSLESLMLDYNLAVEELESILYVEFDGGIIVDISTINKEYKKEKEIENETKI